MLITLFFFFKKGQVGLIMHMKYVPSSKKKKVYCSFFISSYTLCFLSL